MKKLFSYLKNHKLSVLVVVILLLLKAYCELALPSYTSDIVDVGIQQAGIENAAIEQMRPETYENICLFLTDDEMSYIDEYYEINSDGNYELITTDTKIKEQISETLSMPMAALYNMESSDSDTLTKIKAALESNTMTKEELLSDLDDKMSSYEDLSDTMITQMAVVYIQEEYQAIGLDTDAMQTNYLWVTGAKMLGFTVVMMVAGILLALLSSKVAAQIGCELRSKVFHKVVSFSNTELDHFSTASLITRSTNDIQQIQMVMMMLLRMVLYAPILAIGGIVKVMSTQTGMGWIIGVAVIVIIGIVGVLMAATMPRFKKMQILVDNMNRVSREILTGVPVIRAFGREKEEEKRFGVANTDLMKNQMFTSRVMSLMMPLMMLLMNAITVLIVWVGANGIDVGNLQVGDMMAFITYTMQIVMSFLMISMISIMLPRAGVAATRIDEILTTKSVVKEIEEPKGDEKIVNGDLVFEDVSFEYPGADENAVSHISFSAKQGQTTAIIGSTGCGKSTILHLIPRFYDVSEGRITYGTVDIRNLSFYKLRSLIGFVPQKGVLFSGNVTSNLKFAGDDITDEQMKEAAKIAQADSFINEMEEGYESPVSQGGINVSGGQKQRLSIARAIVKEPKILLFDDSFSALDYKTDASLRKALAEKTKKSAVIIVAQRISTILHADQIIVLEDGQIVGKGNHEYLMEHCEAYEEIARSQLSEAELKGGCQ